MGPTPEQERIEALSDALFAQAAAALAMNLASEMAERPEADAEARAVFLKRTRFAAELSGTCTILARIHVTGSALEAPGAQ